MLAYRKEAIKNSKWKREEVEEAKNKSGLKKHEKSLSKLKVKKKNQIVDTACEEYHLSALLGSTSFNLLAEVANYHYNNDDVV